MCFRFLLSKNQMNGVLVFAYLRQKIKTMIENFEKSREIMACTMKSLSCPFDSQGNGGDHRLSKSSNFRNEQTRDFKLETDCFCQNSNVKIQ